RDPVFRSGPSPSPSGLPFHFRLVTSQEGDIVLQHRKLIDFQPASCRKPECVLGFSQAIKISMVDGKTVIPDGEIRVELDSFPGFGERLFILVNDPRQYLVGLRLTG